MKKKIKNSCINEFDPSAIDEIIALKKILASIVSIKKTESLNIKDTLGRICAKDIKSKINIPTFRNSAMDGYAINIKDLKNNKYTLKESSVSLAGRPTSSKLLSGETIRVMTGAMIPNNCDAVVMKEMVEINHDKISFSKYIKKNQNIRFIGEDIKRLDKVIKKGQAIEFVHLGLLSSVGIKSIKVFIKPTISYFSTGDELISVNKKLKKGMIYDSNRYLLHGLLSKLPVKIKDMGVVKDNQSALIKKLTKCSAISDFIITTGGVSVGDADFIKDALEKIGKINFWKIAVKPGRPLAYGKINKVDFFGLPGNPVSTIVTFQLFVQPAIEKLINLPSYKNLILRAKTMEDISKKKGRVEYKRAYLSFNNDMLSVKISGLQGSNILTSLSKANCYIRLSSNVKTIKKNSFVDVIPFGTRL